MPPVSQAQRAAMHAAAEGKSTLGIPKSVGEEFSEADPGGKLPAHKDAEQSEAEKIAEFRRSQMNPTDPKNRRIVTLRQNRQNAAQGKNDGINHDPADITRLSERCDAIADSLRDVGRRMDAEKGSQYSHAEHQAMVQKLNNQSRQAREAKTAPPKKDTAGGEAEGKKLDAWSSEAREAVAEARKGDGGLFSQASPAVHREKAEHHEKMMRAHREESARSGESKAQSESRQAEYQRHKKLAQQHREWSKG